MSRFLTEFAKSLPSSVPFTGPETLERGRGQPFLARLGANELGFGPSPLAQAAMQDAAGQVWKYGDPESYELKQALAAKHGCTAENIIIGQGIDGLLGVLTRLCIAQGTPAVTSLGGYPTFSYHLQGNGAVIHQVPYRDDHQDPQALLDAAHQHGAKLIYLSNPDNPMANAHRAEVIEDMIANLPAGSLLILDEAYADFAPQTHVPTVAIDHPQVIRFRTFSKAYGLAGARIGYGLAAPELIKAFDKMRDHFGVSSIAQAGALASLADPDHLPKTLAHVAQARATIAQIACDNGLQALPSFTNFVTIDCGRDGDFARKVLQECQKRGLFIRMPWVAPMDRCIRISLGTQDELAIVANILPQALDAARS